MNPKVCPLGWYAVVTLGCNKNGFYSQKEIQMISAISRLDRERWIKCAMNAGNTPNLIIPTLKPFETRHSASADTLFNEQRLSRNPIEIWLA